jgi:hypothetical protein
MSGQIPIQKLPALAQKFHDRYGIGCSPAQRITRKQHGKANAILVLYAPENALHAEWCLLATQGEGLECESLQRVDARPRLSWLGYELIRHATRQRTSWTWRRPKAEMSELYSILASQLNPRQMDKVADTLARIARQPGFHGVREQSFALMQYARVRGYGGEIPFLFYVEKVSHGERLLLEARR